MYLSGALVVPIIKACVDQALFSQVTLRNGSRKICTHVEEVPLFLLLFRHLYDTECNQKYVAVDDLSWEKGTLFLRQVMSTRP